MKVYFLTLITALLMTHLLTAQEIVVPEEVKSKCENIALDQKVKLAVARFSQSTSGRNTRNLDNFSTMLSNAMFEIDCFRMLSLIQDNNYRFSSGDDAIKPHFIITGEITEYSHEEEEKTVLFVKETTITAHLGFILQIKDPHTREIIFSKSFNQEGSSANSDMELRVRGRRYKQSRSRNSVDQAYGDAFEKGVLEAVTYIVDNRNRIYQMTGMLKSGTVKKGRQFQIHIENASFSHLLDLENQMKSDNVIHDTAKQLDEGNGTITVRMSGSLEELSTIVMNNIPQNASITAFDQEGKSITVTIK